MTETEFTRNWTRKCLQNFTAHVAPALAGRVLVRNHQLGVLKVAEGYQEFSA